MGLTCLYLFQGPIEENKEGNKKEELTFSQYVDSILTLSQSFTLSQYEGS